MLWNLNKLRLQTIKENTHKLSDFYEESQHMDLQT